MTPLCDHDIADEDAIMSVEEGGVEVRENAVPGPSESRDELSVLLPDWHSLARGIMRMRGPSMYHNCFNVLL